MFCDCVRWGEGLQVKKKKTPQRFHFLQIAVKVYQFFLHNFERNRVK